MCKSSLYPIWILIPTPLSSPGSQAYMVSCVDLRPNTHVLYRIPKLVLRSILKALFNRRLTRKSYQTGLNLPCPQLLLLDMDMIYFNSAHRNIVVLCVRVCTLEHLLMPITLNVGYISEMGSDMHCFTTRMHDITPNWNHSSQFYFESGFFLILFFYLEQYKCSQRGPKLLKLMPFSIKL